MTDMNEYTYHLGVYSKLIRGRDPNGAIKRGTEARVNGRTDNFPTKLHSLCRPSLFFVGEPLITDVDPRQNMGGAFVYQPIQIDGVHYSAFGRVQARSENGHEAPGRKFTHCAVIFVERKWEPGLIKWAAEMLFTNIHSQRCWGDPITEMDSQCHALPVPTLTHDMLKESITDGPVILGTGHSDASTVMQVRGQIPNESNHKGDVNGINDSAYLKLAANVAAELTTHNLSVEGRWLNLAFGIGVGVEGHGAGGFFICFDSREEDRLSPPPPLHFDDFKPARRFEPVKSMEKGIGINWIDLKGPSVSSPRYQRLTSDDTLWADQVDYLKGYGTATEPHSARSTLYEPEKKSVEIVRPVVQESTPLSLKNPLYTQPKEKKKTPESNPETPFFLNRESDAYSDANYLSYDRIFDPVNLRIIQPAFRQIVGRCQLLDPENGYDVFDIAADFDKYSDAIQHLVEYVCIYATLADVNELIPFLDDLLSHKPIPVLGLPATSRGGLSQLILSATLDTISNEVLREWITRQYRIEGNLRIQKRNNREIDQNYQIYMPQPQRLSTFFSWLNEIDFMLDEHDGRYSSKMYRVIMGEINRLSRVVADNVCEKWNL